MRRAESIWGATAGSSWRPRRSPSFLSSCPWRVRPQGVAGSPGLALFAGYVCWTHYTQAHSDGAQVVWGLELAGIGCGLLALSGVRFLTDRS